MSKNKELNRDTSGEVGSEQGSRKTMDILNG